MALALLKGLSPGKLPGVLGKLETRDWLLTLLVLVTLWVMRSWRRVPLPPGPRGLPLIGSLLQLPRSKEWLQYNEWAKQYGPLFHMNLMGGHVFVINSNKVAIDILEKTTLAARPQNMIMATDLIGWGRAVALNPGGEQHRKYRRLLSKVLNSSAVRKFRSLEQRAAEAFLQELYRTPQEFLTHIRDSVGNMIVDMSYGRVPNVGKSGYIDYAEYVHEIFGNTARSFAYLVDIIPLLKHVPEWLPGAGFQRQARKWRGELDLLAQVPFDMVKSDIQKGGFSDSFVSLSLSGKGMNEEDEYGVMWTAVSLYTGGSDTTVASITAFVLLMCLFPDAQARAQKEIDEVVGSDRLPTAEDEERMPYMGALLKEILRYWSIAPIGIPHMATEDTMYGSYVIPKGSTVIANIWGMMHDPAVYSNPFEFKPERFLPVEKGGLDEPNSIPAVFGFACTLAAFKIVPIKNEKGEPVPPLAEASPGIIGLPKPFKCDFIPRSASTASLLGL